MDKRQAFFCVLFYLLVMTEGNSEKSEPILDNFKCVYLFSEKINCTWDVDSKCVNLTFSFGEKNARYEPLERYTCTEPFQARIQCRQIVATTQCYANPKTICLYEHQFYIFSLFGMCRNQAVNETIVIPLNETYVKMKPVKDLKEISSTIDSLTIVWKLVKPQTYYSSSTVICYIDVRSRNQELNITSRSLQSHLYRITIGHLLPGTRYTVKVKCRPRFSVVWSDESSMYAMTDYTVPLIGPSFISSGFVRVSDAILVYFTVPEGHVSQGNISDVKLELQGVHSNKVLTTYTRNIQTAKLTTCWIHGNGRLTVKAITKNQIGWSDNFTEVEYFHDKSVSVSSYVFVEINKTSGRVQISLEYNVRMPVNITYFWCEGTKNEAGNVYCQERLQWITSSWKMLEGRMQTPLDDRWHFGVSISIGKISSGIKWENCIFTQSKMDTEVSYPTIDRGGTYLVVMILRRFCRPNGYRPLYYSVEYYGLNDQRNKTSVRATSSTNNITIKHLVPGTRYHLIYYTEYKYGNSPNVSVSVSTLASQTSESSILSNKIVIGVTCFIGCIFICIILVYKLRKRMHQFYVFLFEKPPIEMPSLNSKCDDSYLKRNVTSEDSGYSSQRMEHNSEDLVLNNINSSCERKDGYISFEDILETPTGRTSPFKLDNVHTNVEKSEEKPTSKEQLKPKENNGNEGMGKQNSLEVCQEIENSISSYIHGDQVNFLGRSSAEFEEGNYSVGDDFDNSDDNQKQHLLFIANDLKYTVGVNSHVNKGGNNSNIPPCRTDSESRNQNTNYVDGDPCAHCFSKDGLRIKTMRNRCLQNETRIETDSWEHATKDLVSSYVRTESPSSEEHATKDSVSSYVRAENMSSGEHATKDSVSSYVRTESMSSRENATNDSVSSYVRAENMSLREHATKDSVSSYVRAESMSSVEHATKDSVSAYVRTESMSSGEHATKDSVSSYVRAESISSGENTTDSVSSYVRAESMSPVEHATKDSVSSYVRTEGMSSGEHATKDSVSSYVRAASISSGEHATKDSVSSYVSAESISSGEHATKDSVSSYVRTGSMSSGEHATKDSVSSYVRAESISSGEHATTDSVSSYVRSESISSGEHATKDLSSSAVWAKSISNVSSGRLNHHVKHVNSETCFTSKSFSTNGLYSQNTCHRCNDDQTKIKNDSKERAIMNSVSSYICADSSYIPSDTFPDVTDKIYKKSILMPHNKALSATPDILHDSTLEKFQLNPVTLFQRSGRKIDTKYGQYDRNSEDKRKRIVEFLNDFDGDVDELIVSSVATTQNIDPYANSQKQNADTYLSYVRAEDLLVTSSSSDHAHTTQEKVDQQYTNGIRTADVYHHQ